jgi:hypothetical protein
MIFFSESFGSFSYAKKLRDRILNEVPHAQVFLFSGREDAFEITVDDKFIYSKLKLRAYPPKRKVNIDFLLFFLTLCFCSLLFGHLRLFL